MRHGPYAFFTLQGFHSVFYVLLYLVAIVGANLSSTYFGPSASIVNAFLLIGLDLTTRDKLHESWQNRGLLPKMTCLIVVGAAISWLLNRNSGPIALASTLAFGLAAQRTEPNHQFAFLHESSRYSNSSLQTHFKLLFLATYQAIRISVRRQFVGDFSHNCIATDGLLPRSG